MRVMAALGCVLAACAGNIPQRQPASPPAITEARPDPAAPPPASRSLPLDADFAELVSTLSELEANGRAACLLARTDHTIELGADPVPALTEAPPPPAALEPRMENPDARVMLLTARGPLGDPAAELLLAALTETPIAARSEAADVLFVTGSGVFLRHADRTGPAAALGPDDLRHLPGKAPLFVTAAADVLLTRIDEVLRTLRPGAPAAFAVRLPAGTRPPPGPPEPESRHCDDGLPPPADDRAEGALDAGGLARALAPLADAATACADTHTEPTTVVVAMRIAESGRVEHACMLESSADARVDQCLLTAIERIALPVPEPAGFVDAHLPLRLEPPTRRTERAACEPYAPTRRAP